MRIQEVLSKGVPTLTLFFFLCVFFLVDDGREGGSKYHYTIISGPSSAQQRNAI